MQKIKSLSVIFILIASVYGFIEANHTTPYTFPELQTFPKMPENSQNPVTVEGSRLGRYLFYDPILSKDSGMRCASCHKQEYAFSGGALAFSVGSDNKLMKRNTPPFFWDGRAPTLEQQILFPVRTHDEMNLTWPVATERIIGNSFYRSQFNIAFGNTPIDSILIAKAIAQFLRTLISHQSKYDRVAAEQARFTNEEYVGFELMNDMTKGDCLHCHSTDGNSLGTTATYSNNGLDEVSTAIGYKDKGLGGTTGNLKDNGKFKIPSIRNIALTAPYMHDGRFKTLEEVIDFYSEGVKKTINVDSKMEFAHLGGANLSASEKKCIVAFLQTFTDSVFISNPEYKDPFVLK